MPYLKIIVNVLKKTEHTENVVEGDWLATGIVVDRLLLFLQSAPVSGIQVIWGKYLCKILLPLGVLFRVHVLRIEIGFRSYWQVRPKLQDQAQNQPFP